MQTGVGVDADAGSVVAGFAVRVGQAAANDNSLSHKLGLEYSEMTFHAHSHLYDYSQI